jgi:flagellar basal body-associated protein FliL
MDKAARRSWIILGIIFAIFMIGLFMVSMWGGPYQAASSWQEKETPAFPN